MDQKGRNLPDSPFLMTGMSIKALSVTFPVFPVLLSVLITALAESLPSGLFHFPSPLSLYTPHSLLLLHLLLLLSFIPSIFLPASLYFTSSHLLIDLYSFQVFFVFSFCPPPLSSSTDRSLLHGRQTRHFSCALSRSLFLTHLCRSLSHIIPLFTHSGSPTVTHMLLSYRTVCTCPQYKIF